MSPPPFVLIVSNDDGRRRSAGYQQLADQWSMKGSRVRIEIVNREESWWLGEREDQGSIANHAIAEAVERTREWILEVLA